MPDILEDASAMEALHLAAAIRATRERAYARVPHGTGVCEWCDEPAAQGRWCSSDCARDQERAEGVRRKQVADR